MKNQKIPTASKFTVLRQLCNYIPPHLVPKLARETAVEEQTRTFDEWSHIVSLCYAQVTHSIGLNDVCDALQLNSGPLSALRGATAPTRNNLSHANKARDAVMAEKLFWAVYGYLGDLSPRFVSGMAAFVDGVLTEAPYWLVRPPKGHGRFLEMDRQPHKEGLLRLFKTQRDRSTRREPVAAEARRGGGGGAWQRH
jgi:hypothetical protein